MATCRLRESGLQATFKDSPAWQSGKVNPAVYIIWRSRNVLLYNVVNYFFVR